MTDIPVQSVRKAFDILSILAFEDIRREGINLTVLAKRLAMRPNTTHNLLKSMCATGFVAQTADSKYMIGPKCLQMGRINQLVSDATIQCVRPILQTLSSSLNESLVFVTMANGKRIPLFMQDSARAIKVDFAAIPDRSIYDMPTGRVLVSYAEPEERAMIIAEWGFPGEYWQDITTHEQLNEACAAVRRQGYTTVTPDINDLFAMACPVHDVKGKLLGALGCYAPMFRCTPEHQNAIIRELLQTAETLQKELSLLV